MEKVFRCARRVTVLSLALGATFALGAPPIDLVNQDGATVELNDALLSISTGFPSEDAVSVSGDAASANPIVVNGLLFDTLQTADAQSVGLYGEHLGFGAVTTTLTDGTILTAGDLSHGIQANVVNATSTAAARAEMFGGSITTTGGKAHSVFAVNSGFGDATAIQSGGINQTQGAYDPFLSDPLFSAAGPHAVYAVIDNIDAVDSTATARLDGGTVSVDGNEAAAVIAINGGQGDASATMTTGSITTSGTRGHGVAAQAGTFTTPAGGDGSASVRIEGGTIMTGGDAAVGGRAANTLSDGSGDATVVMTNGSITMDGSFSFGLQALIQDSGTTGDAAVTMENGTIDIRTQGRGISVQNQGQGDATATLREGQITVAGNGSQGILAQTSFGASSGTTNVLMENGGVETTGNSSDAIRAESIGSTGNVAVTVESGTLSTRGSRAYGVIAQSNGPSATGATSIQVDAADIQTSGSESHGLLTRNFGPGDMAVEVNGGSVRSTGDFADGILAYSQDGNGSYDIDVNAGFIQSGTRRASTIHTVSPQGGTIDVGAAATLDGSGTGVAIRDGGRNNSATDTTGGNVVVTTAGNVIGDAILGLGDDRLDLAGGDFDGSIYGDDMASSASDGDDSFSWSDGDLSGSYFAGNGSDTATISAATYDGTVNGLFAGDGVDPLVDGSDSLTFDGINAVANGSNILDWENVTVSGGLLSLLDGALTVGSASGTGLTINNAGQFDGGNSLDLTGNLNIESGSTFIGTGDGSGSYNISGDVLNNGVISTVDGQIGDQINIAGNYAGLGNVRLDADSATDTADFIQVDGDFTGNPQAVIVNVAPSGEPTGNDIPVINVDGSVLPNDFFLPDGSVASGAYDYTLGSAASLFFLQFAGLNANGATYGSAPFILAGFNRLPTLQQRVGERQLVDWKREHATSGGGFTLDSEAGWIRFVGDREEHHSSNGSGAERAYHGFQVGADFASMALANGTVIFGGTGHMGDLQGEIEHPDGDGSIDTEGYGIGLTATWYGHSGGYVDLQSQLSWMKSDYVSSSDGTLAQNERSRALALSSEVGYRYEMREKHALVPQAQLRWSRTMSDEFTDRLNNRVDLQDHDSWIGRLGLAYEYTDSEAAGAGLQLRVIANILHDFSENTEVRVNGAQLEEDVETTWGEIGVGGTVAVNPQTFIYSELSYRSSLESNNSDNKGASLDLGIRRVW